MQPDRSDASYLWDMLEYARSAAEFVFGRTYDEYLEDKQLRLAVERAIEVIGEAARNLSDSFRSAHPEIPWHSIIAQRHVLAHDYGEVKHDRIWRVATIHVPDLIKQLSPLAQAPPADE